MEGYSGSISELLNSICDSIIKIGIVVFFHHNPGALDTAEGLARWVGRNKEEVEKALLELSRTGVVEAFGEGPSTIYSYTQDEEILNTIDEFIDGLSRESSPLKKTVSLLEGH